MRGLLKFGALALAIACLGACEKRQTLSEDKIYFFYQTTCPHCHVALQHINEVAPNIEIELYEISGEGRDLFLQCVEKFDLPRQAIGTPLICMGDNYIMGWSAEEAVKFDEYVTDFVMTPLN